MKKNLPALALASMLVLTGCDRLGIGNPFSENEVSCGSEEVKGILIQLVRDRTEGETVKTFDDDDFKEQAFADIGIAHIRNMVERLGIGIDEVRTTEKTASSGKLKCEATLRLEIPEDVVGYAAAANRAIGGSNKKTPDFFERHYRKEGAYYIKTIAYSVQQTDDKRKIFAELNQADDVIRPVSELVSMALMKEPLDTARKMNEELEAAEAEAQEARAAEEAAAQEALGQEQEAARVSEWEERYQLARSEFEQFWKGLPPAVQNKLQASQKTWKSGTDKICASKAKAEGETPNGIKISELVCRTAETEARLEGLYNRKKAVIDEMVRESDKKERAAKAALDGAVQALPADIAETVMPEYRNWQNGLNAKCADGDEYGLAQSDCRIRETDAKTKEIRGYLIE
ncbi:DUF1311 domain-containing protein [Neisseria lactamica]|uniref:DUF1311 domain-containing protein n=1 Tax=Neisseria lactamica TaxID=486 RepID=UPI000E56A98F|nr:DUF1311 domain-containing protein [Neisseria lactamica]